MVSPRPKLAFGERFKIRSRAGKLHVMTFLHWTDGADALYVRLNNNEIARLNDARVEWSSCRAASSAIEPPMVPGDPILIDTAQGTSRGWLIQMGQEIKFRRAEGGASRIHLDDIEGFYLLFRARSLKRGDTFVGTRTGGESFRGWIQDLSPQGLATVELADGTHLQLALSSLVEDSVFVLIPVPVTDLVDTHGDLEMDTRTTPSQPLHGCPDEDADRAPRGMLLCCTPLDPAPLELNIPLVVGRSPRLSGLVLPNQGVSREHAEFLRRPDGLYVRDLGSINGTWVDDKRVGDTFVRILPTATVRIEVFHLSIQAAD